MGFHKEVQGLDWIWGEFGNLYLRDRVARFSKRLEHVASPHNSLPCLSKNLPTVGSSTMSEGIIGLTRGLAMADILY